MVAALSPVEPVARVSAGSVFAVAIPVAVAMDCSVASQD
jgi:hypothetical protein